jgi:hypothetical protein
MSQEGQGSQAAEIAAQHVESIMAAAEKSADQLTEEARREAEDIRAKAREAAEHELDAAREEARQLREQTRRQIEGHVSAAEDAAARVLDEAKTLSSGLRQLGTLLQSQGERILRDVQAAHKHMQADLRVGPLDDEVPASRSEAASRRKASSGDSSSSATPEERAALERAAAELRGPERHRARPRESRADDLDLPSWVER